MFKQKSPGNIVVLLIFGLLIKMPLFLYPKAIVTTLNDGRLYQLLIQSFKNNTFFCSALSFSLLYVQALMINYLVNEYRMMNRQNYLPGMAYLLITSLLPEWNYLSAPLLSATFVIWMFIMLFHLYNAPAARAHVYNIGLIAGVTSFIYFPVTGFAICIIIGLMILRPFRINELVLLILGWTTPYYFFGVYLFLVDKLNFANFFPHISVRIPSIKSSILLAISVFLLLIPFLIGGYYVQTHLRKMLIQVRKNWSILLLYLLLAFFVPLINSNLSFHTWVLLAAPFAAFHGCAYFYSQKWLSLTMFFLTIGFILFQQYGTLLWR